jgi:hypothetical protein
MSVSRKLRFNLEANRGRRARSLVFALIIGVLALTAGSGPHVAAQQSISRELYAPFAEVLSATSWLLVTGQDPRHAAPGSAPFWGNGQAPLAPSTAPTESQSAPDPSLIVSQQLGLISATSDPSLAVDPRDSNHLLLAASAFDLPAIVTYASLDGGATWDGPRQVPYFPLDSGSLGGAVVAFDGQGTTYLASRSIAVDTLQVGGQPVQSVRTRIVVATSDDGGLTWNEPVSAALATSDVTTASDESGQRVSSATISLLDWPSLLVAPDPQQPDRSVLFLTYTEFRAQFSALNAGELTGGAVDSTIRLIRSIDDGATWSDPIDVSPTATLSAARELPSPSSSSPAPIEGQPPAVPPTPASPLTSAEGRQVVQGAQAVALSDGTLVVSYFDSTADGPQQGLARIMVATSTDGGRTFAEPTPAGIVRELALTPRTAFARWWSSSFPRLMAAADDTLLIATTAQPMGRPNDDADVFLMRSLDGGASWELPFVLGEDEPGNQFMPAIASAEDGTLHAIWADTGDDPQGVSFVISHALSQDNGATWSDGETAASGRVTGPMSNMLLGFPGGVYLGDRTALAATSEEIYAAWPDTRLATHDAPNQQIGFVSARSSPD